MTFLLCTPSRSFLFPTTPRFRPPCFLTYLRTLSFTPQWRDMMMCSAMPCHSSLKTRRHLSPLIHSCKSSGFRRERSIANSINTSTSCHIPMATDKLQSSHAPHTLVEPSQWRCLRFPFFGRAHDHYQHLHARRRLLRGDIIAWIVPVASSQ